MREFTASTRIAVAPEAAFDFVADYRNVPKVLEGITRWNPLEPDRAQRRGARYDVEMRTFGIPLANRLVLDAWERPRRIGWRSESGLIAQHGSWTFGRHSGGTTVTLRIGYEPPLAALGNLLAGRADAVVRRRLERALAAMKARLEG
jgi:ribosome-associated toxin RatA of RatAB toxin-antitoxin module